jgi:hypothetical protein
VSDVPVKFSIRQCFLAIFDGQDLGRVFGHLDTDPLKALVLEGKQISTLQRESFVSFVAGFTLVYMNSRMESGKQATALLHSHCMCAHPLRR